jgi:GT2 family glycosyltransferase
VFNLLKISIVIATRDRSVDLKRLLLSISNQEYFPLDIVVVDDSKYLLTLELVKSFVFKFANLNLKYIRGSGNGLAEARNLGMRYCEGDIVLFLDDDTEVDSSCLRELTTAMTFDSSIGAAQAKLLQMEQRNTLDCAGVLLNVVGFGDMNGQNEKDIGQYDDRRIISYAKGAAIIVRKDVWTILEGFDPLFSFHFEEVDFCWRVWLSSRKVVFVPSAKVFHHGGTTSQKSTWDMRQRKLQFLMYRNRIIMVAKNLELKNLIRYTPWLFAMSLYDILLNTRRNNCQSVLVNLLGIAWCLRFFSLIWSKRLVVQQKRVLSDKDLFERRAIYRQIFI